MKKLIPILFLIAIILTGCVKATTTIAYVPKEYPQAIKIEEPNLEEDSKYQFVVEENFHPDSQKIFNKKILPLYKNVNSPTPTNNGLIGMDQKKIQRLIGRYKPWYKITIKEYSDGKEVKGELSERELWATGIYEEDPSGIRILFDKGKVVAAWIDELNGPPTSLYDFSRDK